jgi:signal transduction histidine kinase/CheY-like chemotaxis protein
VKQRLFSGCRACALAGSVVLMSAAAPTAVAQVNDPRWTVYTSPSPGFRVGSGFHDDWRRVFENSIVATALIIVLIITLRINRKLQLSRNELDETNRKLKEAMLELRRKEKQIVKQERLRALGEMAGGVAHDFNNALQPIILAAGILSRNEQALENKEKLKEYIQVILLASRDASATVKRLVRFFRPGQKNDRQTVQIAPIVREVVGMTQPKWREEAQARGCRIQLVTDVDDECWTVGYPDELREVLVNLIFNAVEAMTSSGTIRVSARVKDAWTILEVEDDGSGMDPETASRCLEPFFTTKAQRGTGLGLSIVYGVIQRHRGDIQVDSRLGQGTRFTIRLPLRRPGEKADSEPDGPPPAARLEMPEHPLTVLIADDERESRSLMEDVLRAEGHNVLLTSNGKKALQMAIKKKPDVIVTDRAMPGLSGDEIVAGIRNSALDVPVILLTGFGDMIEENDPIRRNVTLVVSKPVTGEDLCKAVRDAYDRHA